MQELEGILFIISGFASIVLIVYILARYRYLTNRKFAESGINPGGIKQIGLMSIGVIILFLGLGLGVSSFVSTLALPEDTYYLLIYSVIFIFGSIGLIVAHFIREKFERRR